MKPPEDFVRDISISEGDFYEVLEYEPKEDNILYLQHCYALLAKCVYLPFLYGYNMGSIMNCRIYHDVRDHVESVKYK